MIQISDSERRRAFSIWLRTGRLAGVTVTDGVELKFNPWHDPADGRFTFAGSGRNYGQSGSGGFRGRGGGSFGGGGASSPRESRSASNQQRRSPAPTPTAKTGPPPHPSLPRANTQRPISQNGWGGGGFTGGGGGSAGGAGASGDWGDVSPRQPQVSKAPATTTKRQPPSSTATTGQHPSVATTATPLHREIRNGYEYQIEDTGRTRRVSGTLTLADRHVRSRTAQAQAGGDDRRLTDDGGHYIAARFNGPTDAFNHFAQDANFNRGEYRLLEDQWARAKRAGASVTVKIVSSYDGASKRPAVIDIWFKIDGLRQSVQIPNEPREKRRGK
jgi:hypothetical protein